MIFTAQELRSIARRYDARFHATRGERWFVIDVAPRAEDIWVQVLLRNELDSFHYPVEARIAPCATRSRRAQAFFLLAFIDSYWEEFFAENEDVFVPIDWTAYEFQGEKFQIRGQVLNRMAEKIADELLAGSH